MVESLSPVRLNRWRLAIFAIFVSSGLSIATWASRLPAIKSTLGIDNAQVGLILLTAGIASITGLTLAPAVMARVGARTTMLAAMLIYAAGVSVVGIGTDVAASPALVTIGMVLFGAGNGAVDVTMNVEAAEIERRYQRTLLPMFHAFFSIGTVAGAGIGALAVALGLNVLAHALIMAALITLIAVVAFTHVPARSSALDPTEDRAPWTERMRTALSAWTEPRIYALGLVALGMSFAEGGANDWLALGLADDHGAGEATGAIGLAVMSVFMTAARMLGGPLVERFGRVATLRASAAAATIGIVLFILAPSVPFAFVGAALWGTGVALGFPLSLSAAADDPAQAAARVSATAAIGYLAFLTGPPLLGMISEQIGLLNTLYILAGLVVLSGLASGSARPQAGSSVGAGHTTGE